jgi:hypothetical protein
VENGAIQILRYAQNDGHGSRITRKTNVPGFLAAHHAPLGVAEVAGYIGWLDPYAVSSPSNSIRLEIL